MFVIGIEFSMLSDGKQKTGVDGCCAPFLVSAVIKRLTTQISCRMVRTKLNPALECDSVAVAPAESPIAPIEIGAVAIRHENPGCQGQTRSHDQHRALHSGLVW